MVVAIVRVRGDGALGKLGCGRVVCDEGRVAGRGEMASGERDEDGGVVGLGGGSGVGVGEKRCLSGGGGRGVVQSVEGYGMKGE